MSQPSPTPADVAAKGGPAPTPAPGPAGTDPGYTLRQPPPAQFAGILAPSQSDGELGRLGGYRIVRLVGEGGMGFVFEAEEIALGRRVALKAIRPEIAVIPETRDRFIREARAAAALRDDHVVPIYQVGEENGVPFLVMPFLPGESLHSRMRRLPRPTVADTVRWGRQVAMGLAAAHAAGLVHRDIKPANLWLEAVGEGTGFTARPRIKILDFGLARAATTTEALTRTGQILGTPAYMSPEQARGEPVDFRADLFSLGSVFYELTTGVAPFQGTDVWSILYSVVHTQPTPPHERDPAVPPDLSALVMKMLEKEPGGRPQSAAKLIASFAILEKRLAGGGAGATRTPPGMRAAEPVVVREKPNALPPQKPAKAPSPTAPDGSPAIAKVPRQRKVARPLWAAGLLVVLSTVIGWGLVVRNNARPPGPSGPVSAAPGAPAPAPFLKPRLRLLPLAPIAVTAGESSSLTIVIERENLPGNVSLSLVSPPDGVRLASGQIPDGELQSAVQLTTLSSALPATRRLVLRASVGDTRAETALPLTVRPMPMGAIRLNLPQSVRLKTGQQTLVEVYVHCEHVTGPLALEWLELPAGVKSPGPPDSVPADSNSARLILAADWSPRRNATVRLRGTAPGAPPAETTMELQIDRVDPPPIDSSSGAGSAADANTAQENWAAYLGKPVTETVDLGGGVKMELVLVPPGTFVMGPTEGNPRQLVTISKPFRLGKTEVTVGQFRQFMSANPGFRTQAEVDGSGTLQWRGKNQLSLRNYTWKGPGFQQTEQHPVVNISWSDALKFCAWLETQTHTNVKLPTEAQWEFGCRAGSTTSYPFGEDAKFLGDHAWHQGNSDNTTHPVAQKKPNAWGLYDMSGNACEWCLDGKRNFFYSSHPQQDPEGAERERVVRGGSFKDEATDHRAFHRDYRIFDMHANEPAMRSPWLGFRASAGVIEKAPSDTPLALDSTRRAVSPVDAKKAQENWAANLGKPVTETVDLGGSVKMEFVLIPPGKFTMGSGNGRYFDDQPPHVVTISKQFRLAKTKVTVGQFKAFVAANPGFKSEAEADGKGGIRWPRQQRAGYTWKSPGFEQADDLPVVQVSWNDAVKFCSWLETVVGEKIALPTEAQWEYSCRAGSTAAYGFGGEADKLADYAWYSDNCFHYGTRPVGVKKPNSWGLYDMHGNVWEWCRDGKRTYTGGSELDPEGPGGNIRMRRGGAFVSSAEDCNAAHRGQSDESERYDILGFRVCIIQ
jgi:formylglycine-generating enzyme required for sulfatase activity